jgi:hypothetical protein
MTTERYGVPEPTGEWYLAIRNLREAYELMKHMTFDDARGPYSLDEMYRQQIEHMIGSIDQHWRWSYMKIATQRVEVVIPRDFPNYEEFMHRLSHCSDCYCKHDDPDPNCGCVCHGEDR